MTGLLVASALVSLGLGVLLGAFVEGIERRLRHRVERP
jgi:hypothetical protein